MTYVLSVWYTNNWWASSIEFEDPEEGEAFGDQLLSILQPLGYDKQKYYKDPNETIWFPRIAGTVHCIAHMEKFNITHEGRKAQMLLDAANKGMTYKP